MHTDEEIKPKIEEMSQWFDFEDVVVSSNKGKEKYTPEPDSETDPDSDYDETKFEDEDRVGQSFSDIDERSTLRSFSEEDYEHETSAEGTTVKEALPVDKDEVKMGEDDEAMEYDTERLFRHL